MSLLLSFWSTTRVIQIVLLLGGKLELAKAIRGIYFQHPATSAPCSSATIAEISSSDSSFHQPSYPLIFLIISNSYKEGPSVSVTVSVSVFICICLSVSVSVSLRLAPSLSSSFYPSLSLSPSLLWSLWGKGTERSRSGVNVVQHEAVLVSQNSFSWKWLGQKRREWFFFFVFVFVSNSKPMTLITLNSLGSSCPSVYGFQ